MALSPLSAIKLAQDWLVRIQCACCEFFLLPNKKAEQVGNDMPTKNALMSEQAHGCAKN